MLHGVMLKCGPIFKNFLTVSPYNEDHSFQIRASSEHLKRWALTENILQRFIVFPVCPAYAVIYTSCANKLA